MGKIYRYNFAKFAAIFDPHKIVSLNY